MKKMSIFSLTMAFLLGSTVSNNLLPGIPKQGEHNTYNGTPITRHNILTLAPKIIENSELKASTVQWMAQNGDVACQLAQMPVINSFQELKQKRDNNKALYEQRGLHNLSNWGHGNNCTFKTSDGKAIIKIAGLTNKILSLCVPVLNQDPYAKQLTEEQLKKITVAANTNAAPVQGISRLFYYLRFKEAAKKYNWTHVNTPTTYACNIPGNIPHTCDDANYIIVQPTHMLKEPSADDIKSWSKNTLQEIKEAIENTPLWSIAGNTAVDTQNPDCVYFTDLEQPNNSTGWVNNNVTDEFPYQGDKGYWKFSHDASVGLEEMGNKIKNASLEQYEVWKQLQ